MTKLAPAEATTRAAPVSAPAPVSAVGATGKVTQENLAEYMQEAAEFYAQTFPDLNKVMVEVKVKVKVEDRGKEVLKEVLKEVPWVSLSPKEKFDVVYEHSLPHNKPKLMTRDKFSSDAAWVDHIENRLFRGSHKADGTSSVYLKTDPRRDHGTDHGMRVGLGSSVYGWLYDKYDASVHLTTDDKLMIPLIGAFHDSGRQTEGVDIDDKHSAKNAELSLKKWGVAQKYVEESDAAISDKDNPLLATKPFIAKCVQSADSTEYERVNPGHFEPTYLDIYNEFNDEEMAKPLKEGRTLNEFNMELNALTKEMHALMYETSTYEARAEFSQPGKKYAQEIVKKVTSNPAQYPRLNVVFEKCY